MPRRLGRWREEAGGTLAERPALEAIDAALAEGDAAAAGRLLAPWLDQAPLAVAERAARAALGTGGRAGGHRLALLIGAHPALAPALTLPHLQALVPAGDWPAVAAGLRLGIDGLALDDPAAVQACARLLHLLPRSPGELDELRERAARMLQARHVHALLDGLAASGRWAEAADAAAAHAREARRADQRVALLDRAALLSRRAGDGAAAARHAGRALLLSPRPWRAYALYGLPDNDATNAVLDGVLDEIYDDEEPDAASCQVILELGSGALELAMDRAEAAPPRGLGGPGDPLQWVLAGLLVWGRPGAAVAVDSPLGGWLADRVAGAALRGHPLAVEGPVLPGGIAAACRVHQQLRPALGVEAGWARGSALALITRLVDGLAGERARYAEVGTLVGAWAARAAGRVPGPELAGIVAGLAGRARRHAALRRAILSAVPAPAPGGDGGPD